MQITPELYSVVLALAVALAAGLVGSFALMKRMSLAGDVISHVALPGLGIAFLIHANPLIGGGIALFLGTLLIWQLQKSSTLSTETAIGVIFVASVAIGTLLTPEEDLIEALFGGFAPLDTMGFLLGLGAVIVIVSFILSFRDELILALFSPELAATSGINVNRLNLQYLLVFSLTILAALQFLGALLVGALLIVPAAIGRQLTHTLGAFLITSAAASVLSVGLGLLTSHLHHLALGPTIVSIASLLFVLSLLKKKK
ncbi:MAG: metal ABC transporter permease [Patescibacteria group bacterium]